MLNGSHAATPYRFVACLTLIIAAITAHAQDWKTYTYAADGFSVSLPSDPKADKESVDTDGGPVELRSYLATDGDVALYVGLCDYGPKAAQANSDDVLQGAKKGALNNAKATLVSEKPITLGANHGLEFEATSSSGHISARIYMVGGILYQMIVVVPPNGSYANRTRFLDSFHLIVPANFSAGLLAVLGARVARPLSQTVQQEAVVHVELLVQLQHPEGEPVGYLTAKDFVVTEGGQRLPVEVLTPSLSRETTGARSVPTRMLVIVDAPTANSPDGLQRILKALGPVWRRGWQVAVAQIDGNASSYAASIGELRRNWVALGDSPMKTTAAVQDLQSFLGRRVVLYTGNAGQYAVSAPNWLRSQAQDAMADLIVVGSDGPPLMVIHNMDVNDRLNLRGAVGKALHGALGYYDLRVPLSAGTSPGAALSVTIRRDQDLKVLSQVFGAEVTLDIKVTTKVN